MLRRGLRPLRGGKAGQMPDAGRADYAAGVRLFKAFSDKTRLRILSALAIHELCVCDIADLWG